MVSDKNATAINVRKQRISRNVLATNVLKLLN